MSDACEREELYELQQYIGSLDLPQASTRVLGAAKQIGNIKTLQTMVATGDLLRLRNVGPKTLADFRHAIYGQKPKITWSAPPFLINLILVGPWGSGDPSVSVGPVKNVMTLQEEGRSEVSLTTNLSPEQALELESQAYHLYPDISEQYPAGSTDCAPEPTERPLMLHLCAPWLDREGSVMIGKVEMFKFEPMQPSKSFVRVELRDVDTVVLRGLIHEIYHDHDVFRGGQ